MKEIPGLKTTTGGYFAQIESLIDTCREFHGNYRVPLDNITFAASYTCESDNDIRKLAEDLVETGINEDQLSGLIGIISKNDIKEPMETWSVLLMEKQNVVSALRYIRCKPKMLETSPEWLTVENPCLAVEIVGVPVGFFRSCSKHLSASGIHEMRVCMSSVLYEHEHVRDTTVLKAVRRIHDLRNSETTKHWNDFAKKGILSTKGSLWMPVCLVCSSPEEIYQKVLQIVQNYQKENKETRKRLLKTQFMMKIIKLLYENRKNLSIVSKQLEAMEKDLRKNGTQELVTEVPATSKVVASLPCSSKETPKRSRSIKQKEPAGQTTSATSPEPSAKRSRRSGAAESVVTTKTSAAKAAEPTKKAQPTSAKKLPVARKTRQSNEKPTESQEKEQVQVVLPDVKADSPKVGKTKPVPKASAPKRNPPTGRTTRRSRAAAEPETSTVELPNVEMEEIKGEIDNEVPSTNEEPMETTSNDEATDVKVEEKKDEPNESMQNIEMENQSEQSEDQPQATTSDKVDEVTNNAEQQMNTDEVSAKEIHNEPIESEVPTVTKPETSMTAMDEDHIQQLEITDTPEETVESTEDNPEATENESVKAVESEEPFIRMEEVTEANPDTSRHEMEENEEEEKEKSSESTESFEEVDETTMQDKDVAVAEYERDKNPETTMDSADFNIKTPKTPEAVDDSDSGENKSSSSPVSSVTSEKDSSEKREIPLEQNEVQNEEKKEQKDIEADEEHEEPVVEEIPDNQPETDVNMEVNEETKEEQKHVPLILPSSVELSVSPLAIALSMRVTLESDDLYIIWVDKLDVDLLASVNMNAPQCIVCVKNFDLLTESNEIINRLPTEDREMTTFSLLESNDDVIQWTAISFSAELRPLPAELKNKMINSYTKVEEFIEDNSRGWDICHLAKYSKEGFFPRLATQMQNNMLACNYNKENA